MTTWDRMIRNITFFHAFHAVEICAKGVGMRVFLSVLSLLFWACHAVAGELDLDAEQPFYHNCRYGFSLCLTPGRYSAFESENGDGITVRDGNGLELRAWGSLEQDVFGLTLEDFFKRAAGRGAQYEKVSAAGKWYVVSGVKDDAIYYEKSYYTDSAVVTMLITYPERTRSRYERFVQDASKGFKP